MDETTGKIRLKHQVLTKNAAKCKDCGDIIESKHRHDMVSCQCGSIAIDGGLDYIKVSAKSFSLVESLCEFKSNIIEVTQEQYSKGFYLEKDYTIVS
jgi:hypothetical protein